MFLKKYSNRIYQYLDENNRFPIASFKSVFFEEKGEQGLRIRYEDSPMYFEVLTQNSFHQFVIRGTWFEKNYPAHYIIATKSSIEHIISGIKNWLLQQLWPYKIEADEEDLWQRLQANHQGVDSFMDFEDQTSFTEDEKLQVRLKLGEVKMLMLETYDFNEAQTDKVLKSLQYLDERLDRVNKTDWRGIAISTMMSLIIALSVNTDTGQAIWKMFKSAFQNLPHLPMPF